MSARDIRYGRRGGRWATPGTGAHRRALTDAIAKSRDGRRTPELAAEVLFHPETIARRRAHQRQRAHGPDTDCPAVPDVDDVVELWADRARMATARQAAGLPLGRLDRQALALATAPKEAAS